MVSVPKLPDNLTSPKVDLTSPKAAHPLPSRVMVSLCQAKREQLERFGGLLPESQKLRRGSPLPLPSRVMVSLKSTEGPLLR